MVILLFSARMLGSIWFKHIASTRTKKAPGNIFILTEVDSNTNNLFLPPFYRSVRGNEKIFLNRANDRNYDITKSRIIRA